MVNTTTATLPFCRSRPPHYVKRFRWVHKEHQPEATNGGIEALTGQFKVFGSSSQSRDICQTSGASILLHMAQH